MIRYVIPRISRRHVQTSVITKNNRLRIPNNPIYTKLLKKISIRVNIPTLVSDITNYPPEKTFQILKSTKSLHELRAIVGLLDDKLSWVKLFQQFTKNDSLKLSFNQLNQTFNNSTKDYYLTKAYLLLYKYNNQPTNILHLNINWIDKYDDKLLFEYLSTYLINLINTNQPMLANQDYTGLFKEYSKRYPTGELLKKLPSEEILINCVKQLDFTTGIYILEKVIKHSHTLSQDIWLESLQIALEYNNYKTVKLIYDNFLMKEFPQAKITPETVILTDKFTDLFNSLTDNLISNILDVFVNHGDISSTLNLIESHYIHKQVQGSRAMNNQLLCKIIHVYCITDEDIVKVLSLIDDNGQTLTYQDISSSMNRKFMTLNINDRNIHEKKKLQDNVEQLVRSGGDIKHKNDNPNLYNSKKGVILLNRQILDEFIATSLQYNYQKHTRTLLVNCLLNHMKIFGNFTGIVNVLHSFSKTRFNWFEDLNQDSYNIIFASLGNSTQCALHLFNYFKQLTREQYNQIVHLDPEFYIYNYLKQYGELSQETITLLPNYMSNLPRTLTHEQLEACWQEHNLSTISTTSTNKNDETNLHTLRTLFKIP